MGPGYHTLWYTYVIGTLQILLSAITKITSNLCLTAKLLTDWRKIAQFLNEDVILYLS